VDYRRHWISEARQALGGRATAVLRHARQGRELPGRSESFDRNEARARAYRVRALHAKSWTEDKARCKKERVPADLLFKTKTERAKPRKRTSSSAPRTGPRATTSRLPLLPKSGLFRLPSTIPPAPKMLRPHKKRAGIVPRLAKRCIFRRGPRPLTAFRNPHPGGTVCPRLHWI
jgi:hypothetical protein